MRFGLFCSLLFVAAVGCTKSKPATAPSGSPASNPSSTVTEPPPPLPTKNAKVLTPKATFTPPYKVEEDKFYPIMLSDDATRLVLFYNAKNVAHIYDLTAAPKKLHEVPCTNLKALSPDGKKLVCERPGSVYGGIVDTDTNALICSFKEDVGFVTFLTPDTIVSVRPTTKEGKQAVEIKSLSAKNGEKQKDHAVPAWPENAFWNHHLVHGNEFVVGSGSTGKFTFWDVLEGRSLREVTLANLTPNRGDSHFKVSPDGKWLKCEQGDGPRFYDAQTGAEANKPDKSLYYFSSLTGAFIPGREAFLSYRPTGMGALASDPKIEAAYTVLDVKQPTVKYLLPNKGSAFAISGNGKVLVTQDDSGQVRLWDLTQTQ